MNRVLQLLAVSGTLIVAGCSSNSLGTNRGAVAPSNGPDAPVIQSESEFGEGTSIGRRRSSSAGSGRIDAASASIGLIGAEIGRSLDDLDRQQAFAAAQTSFRSGKTTKWTNQNTGNYGTIDPTPTYTSPSGQTCRNFAHKIFVNGRSEDVKGESCRQRGGTWAISS